MKSSSDVQPRFFYFLSHALNQRNQRRLSSRLSIPMILGTNTVFFSLIHNRKITRGSLLHAHTLFVQTHNMTTVIAEQCRQLYLSLNNESLL